MILTSVVHILHRMNRMMFLVVLVLKHGNLRQQQEITHFTEQFQLPM